MTHIFFFLDVGFSVRLRLGRHLEFFFSKLISLSVPPGKENWDIVDVSKNKTSRSRVRIPHPWLNEPGERMIVE